MPYGKVQDACEQLQVYITDPRASVPHQGSEYAAGLDLYPLADVVIPARSVVQVPHGIKIALPRGTAGLVCPRSGLSLRQPVLRIANAPGVIDEDYRGEVCTLLHNAGDEDIFLPGDKAISQLVVVPVVPTQTVVVGTVEDLGVTQRNEGGFGSTDIGLG